MWNKIKKFFKWIADHTGISWVARKISSSWKWLFGGKASATQKNTSQQEESPVNKEQEPAQANDQSKGTTTPKTLDDEVNPDRPTPAAAQDKPQEPVINTSETGAKAENFPTPNLKNADSDVPKEALNKNYLELQDDKKLSLILTPEQLVKCKENSESTKLDALLVYIKCDANEYRITGKSVDKKTISIESIKKKDENGQFEEISAKEILGSATVKKVDSISNKPFKAATPEQPNPNVTSHNATQQVVNNEGETAEPEGFFDATEDIIQTGSTTTDQTPEQPASGSEVASPSGSQSTTADSNEPKSNDSTLNQQSAGPGGLFQSNDKEPQSTTPNQPVNQDNMAGQDSSNIGETQNSPTTDLTTEQSTSSADKKEYFDAEDNGVTQSTPSAVPNKSQDNSIVINGIVIPEGAKLKFFPEISDFLSRASLERGILFYKVAPNSLFTQPITQQHTVNDNVQSVHEQSM